MAIPLLKALAAATSYVTGTFIIFISLINFPKAFIDITLRTLNFLFNEEDSEWRVFIKTTLLFLIGVSTCAFGSHLLKK